MKKLLALTALLFSSFLAHGQTQYFVSTTGGNDANNGTSAGTAWKTIGHAIATLNPAGGYVVNVSPGTYTENISIPIAKSGPSTTQRGVYRCTQAWSVPSNSGCLLRGTGSTDTALNINANNIDFGALPKLGFDISNPAVLAYGITVGPCNIANGSTGQCNTGNSVHLLGDYVHDLSNTANPCEVQPNGHPGVSFNNHHGPFMVDAQVIGLRITNIGNQSLSKLNGGPGCNDYYGMYIETEQAVLQDLIIANTAGYGIQYYSSPCKGTISNNDISRTERNNIVIGGGDCGNGTPAGSVTITNNIFGQTGPGFNNLSIGVQGGSGFGSSTHPVLLSNNIFSGSAAGPLVCVAPCFATNTNAITNEAPTTTFVTYTGGNNDDFHLKSGSQAVGTGSGPTSCALNGFSPCVYPNDFEGTIRPNPPSRGAYELSAAGGTASTSVSPLAFNFGSVILGNTSATQLFTFSSTGTGGAAATLISNTISGPNAADFFHAGVGNCINGNSYNPGTNCTMSVNFAPSTTGPETAIMTVVDSSGSSPHVINLSGAGASASTSSATLTPSSFNFGSSLIGTATGTQTFTYTSTGSANVVIGNISMGGTNPGDFPFPGTSNCTNGQSLATGNTCHIDVQFKPTVAGARSATLTVTDNGTGSPHTSALTGTGTAVPPPPPPAIGLSQSSVAFGNVSVFSNSTGPVITITNTGGSNLVISSIGGVDATNWSQSSTGCLSGPIAPGGTCSVSAVFSPGSVGAKSTTLTITANTTPSTSTISLTGTGVQSNISIFPLALTFSDTPIGSTSPAQTLTITNNSATAQAPLSIGITGDYTQTNTCAAGFSDTFASGSLSSLWTKDSGAAPGTIAGVNTGTFSTANVDLSQNVLGLKVTQTGGSPVSSTGAEVRSVATYGYGTYDWSMRAASTSTTPGGAGSSSSGQISSDFLFINNSQTELDVPEFEGQFPNQAEFTTWHWTSSNQTSNANITSPQNAFHHYKVVWAPGSASYFIDGTQVATHTTNVPTDPAFILMNLWGTNSTGFGGLANTSVTRWMYINSFSFVPNSTTIPAGGSCTVSVQFAPTGNGSRPGGLTVTVPDLAPNASASLAGNGIVPTNGVLVIGGVKFQIGVQILK